MTTTIRQILEQLTVLASIRTINVMNNPQANKEVKHYMKGAIDGAEILILKIIESALKKG